jgi:hypothetical protein
MPKLLFGSMPVYQLGKRILKFQPSDVIIIVIQFSFVVLSAGLRFRDIYGATCHVILYLFSNRVYPGKRVMLSG